jgi:hypothetical protein
MRYKETFIFLFFLFLSFIFWMMHTMQEEYETQIVIPVVYKGLSAETALTDSPPRLITAHVRDRGSVLTQYSLRKKPLSVDLSRLTAGQSVITVGDASLESLIMKYLESTTALLSYSPRSISISCDIRVKKLLPVTFGGEIRTLPGYVVSGSISFSPAEITVYAGESSLDTLTSVATEYIEISNAGKPIIRRLRLNPPPGAVAEPDAVTASIPIEASAEKTIEIQVSEASVPLGYKMRMFPSMVSIACRVPLSLFRELSAEHFTVDASLANFTALTAPRRLPLKITRKPAWVEQAILSHDSIEFILEELR